MLKTILEVSQKATFDITQRGFMLQLCQEQDQPIYFGNDCYLVPGYVVNGYPVDGTDNIYYIECYRRLPDSGILQLIFCAEVCDYQNSTTVDTSFIERIADVVIDSLIERGYEQ